MHPRVVVTLHLVLGKAQVRLIPRGALGGLAFSLVLNRKGAAGLSDLFFLLPIVPNPDSK